jgi:LysR family transcriptional regulator, transcriptional activator of nhaA
VEFLNYHHLRYFWTVAKEGSLRVAAEKLGVSQPSISAQLRALEESLGQSLFRRSGRGKALTEAGQVAFRYAEEIFSLGREMVNALKQQPTAREIRFYVGIADSFPKLVTNEILRPVFTLPQAVHIICREGKLEDLLGQLGAHRLDMVLADEPPSSNLNFRVFNHSLGESGTTFFAASSLAVQLRKKFPASLDGAPALLPAENTILRRALERWFAEQHLRPRVVAEFEDLALMKVMALEGRGFIAVPTVAAKDAVEHYGFQLIGHAEKCRVHFYALTAERRMVHPAVALIAGEARRMLQ